MNKKLIAILVAALIFIVSAVVTINSNRDNDTNTATNPSTEDIQSTDDFVSDNVADKTDKVENSTNKNDEPQSTESSTKNPDTLINDTEPARCQTCDKIIVSDFYQGDMMIGDYCDGKCNEWLGDLEP